MHVLSDICKRWQVVQFAVDKVELVRKLKNKRVPAQVTDGGNIYAVHNHVDYTKHTVVYQHYESDLTGQMHLVLTCVFRLSY